MDDEQKYKDALERAKKLYEQGTITESLSYVFPELVESEDEKLRKALIKFVQIDNWLKKHINVVEQKHDDKVEPKFHEGDWVVWQDKCYKVNYNDCGYELIDQNGLSTSLEYGTIDTSARLWDIIKDAKNGDVLVSQYNKPFIYNGNRDSFHVGSYCGISVDDRFNVSTEKCYWTGNVSIHPATKEQRDLLFTKMHEAGYEWDADKKELKKIHIIDEGKAEMDYCFTKMMNGEKVSPAWSEVDELSLKQAIYVCHQNGYTAVENWLKSIKQRIGWKPTEEQIKAFEYFVRSIGESGYASPYENNTKLLYSLLNDLKKLIE